MDREIEAFRAEFGSTLGAYEGAGAGAGAGAAAAAPHARHVHLNNAGLAPLSRSVREAVARFLLEEGACGAHGIRAAWGALETARRTVARFLEARAAEVAFTAGCAEGLSAVAQGLVHAGAIGPGDEIVSFEGEYPSNAYCWSVAAGRVGGRFLRVPGFDPGALLDAVGPRTRVVVFSSVQSFTGDALPVESLVEACRERFGRPEDGGPWIVVDAIQDVGARPFSFPARGGDVLAFASHKWLCSTPGTGVLVVREDLVSRLVPPTVGAMSYGTPDDPFDAGRALRPDAKRFEGTTANLVGAVALGAAIDLLARTGMERVAGESARLKALLVRGLASLGARFEGANVRAPQGSPILTFTLGEPALDVAVHDALDAARVSHVFRFGRLRLSPHAFNDNADVAVALEAIASGAAAVRLAT